jgi:hypothetical protein
MTGAVGIHDDRAAEAADVATNTASGGVEMVHLFC